jgi:hypothetical protein
MVGVGKAEPLSPPSTSIGALLAVDPGHFPQGRRMVRFSSTTSPVEIRALRNRRRTEQERPRVCGFVGDLSLDLLGDPRCAER